MKIKLMDLFGSSQKSCCLFSLDKSTSCISPSCLVPTVATSLTGKTVGDLFSQIGKDFILVEMYSDSGSMKAKLIKTVTDIVRPIKNSYINFYSISKEYVS